ncbi:hypothetical protein BY458DRAFT_281339 [Sporodiniella umbellata]|nr:hypothetical protein BY458DRAFT_281339 [Sporodiniella umbellata]
MVSAQLHSSIDSKKVKKNPCEGCRERKKKCSTDFPCERCKRLGVECQYLKPTTFLNLSDLESSQCQKLQIQVEVLKDMMKQTERSLTTLRQTNTANTQQTPRKNNAQWQLTINKDGTISIITDIKTHTELLENIEFLSNKSFSMKKQNIFDSCNTFLRRYNYEKTLRKDVFRTLMKCVEYNENGTSLIKAAPLDELLIDVLAPKLLQIYFSCQFFVIVPFHRKTFMELFVKNRTQTSPVVYALCAALLTNRCRHTLKVVPSERNASFGRIYHQRARNAIANQFDVANLETMMTYVYLASYKTNTLYPREAAIYLEMALRIRRVLAEGLYKSPAVCRIEEYETFKRQGVIFEYIIMMLEYFNNERGVPVERQKTCNPINMEKLRQYIIDNDLRYEAVLMSDEPSCIGRSITGRRYAEMIRNIVGPYYRSVRYGKNDDIPISLPVKAGSQLRHVYFESINIDYRLPNSAFESGLNDSEFRKRIRDYCNCDPVSINLAILFQQSLIGIYEPFSPTLPKQKKSEEETLDAFELNARKTCHDAAVVVVRLLEYLIDSFEVCNFHLGLIISVWEAHARNACLGMTDSELAESDVYEYQSAEEIQVSREYALRCAEILRRGYLFNGTETRAWEYLKDYERKLVKTVYTFPKQKAECWDPILY